MMHSVAYQFIFYILDQGVWSVFAFYIVTLKALLSLLDVVEQHIL